MTKRFRAAVVTGALLASGVAGATPSTTFWTPATTYVQPFLVPHVTYDTYFRERAAYPIDTGLTMGVLPFEKLQAEIGFDLFYPVGGSNPGVSALQLNAKLGVPEGAFGEWFPGISGGIMGVGVKKDVSDYNLLHAELSKTLGPIGTVVVGGYYGLNDRLFVDENGSAHQAGFIGAYITPDLNVNLPGLTKVNLFGDVQTGKSSFGAVAAGIGLYFTPAIDILTGPVFFFNDKVQPGQQSWMWSVQLDVDIELFRKPEPPRAAEPGKA